MGLRKLSLLLAARAASRALALLSAASTFFWAAICCALERPSSESSSESSESESEESESEEDSDDDSDEDSSVGFFAGVAFLGGAPLASAFVGTGATFPVFVGASTQESSDYSELNVTGRIP